MWDSVLSARIARWVVSCEEGGLQSSQTSCRDEVVERSLRRHERKVPKTMSGAIINPKQLHFEQTLRRSSPNLPH
jgi:hypothetical protein